MSEKRQFFEIAGRCVEAEFRLSFVSVRDETQEYEALLSVSAARPGSSRDFVCSQFPALARSSPRAGSQLLRSAWPQALPLAALSVR